MVKKIEQGRKGAPLHTSKFLSLKKFHGPSISYLPFAYTYSTKHICGKKIKSLIFLYKEFLYSAWTGVGFRGISWDLMGFSGISWDLVGFHRIEWDFMGFSGI